tara:strand:+ start:793 stop:1530 length:738 start_codon:yes stop_codon:yes gene_type:complete
MSILNVNKINPVGGGSTITIAGIASVTGNITATTFVGAHSGSGANLTSLPAANLTGSLPAISAANLTNIPAGNLTGIITSGRLGGGTASNTTFLRGDGTFQTVTSTSATATPRIGNNTISGQRVASDLTYSSGSNGSNVQLGNVTGCNASSVYALEISLTYMHNGGANHGYLVCWIYQRGKTYNREGSYYSEQHYDWYYNLTYNRSIIPWDPSGTQALDMYITNAYNTNSDNRFYVDISNKLENI